MAPLHECNNDWRRDDLDSLPILFPALLLSMASMVLEYHRYSTDPMDAAASLHLHIRWRHLHRQDIFHKLLSFYQHTAGSALLLSEMNHMNNEPFVLLSMLFLFLYIVLKIQLLCHWLIMLQVMRYIQNH